MDKKIRILQVFTNLNRGGAETNVMNYYRNIDRTKIQFDFLVHRQEEGAYEKEIIQLGGKIFRLPPINPSKIKSYKVAVEEFFNRNSDYDIIHGQLSELGVFIYEEAKKRQIPVIIAHAHNSPKLKDYDIKFLFREIWKRRMRKSLNTFFTCGEDSARWLFGKKNARKAYLMTNAVDSKKFSFNSEDSKKIRKELSAENSFNIFNVGRFNEQKNHIFLLEIFKEVIKLKKESHLFLVGEGELKDKILSKITELSLQRNVTLLGVRSDVHKLFQGMDVFLFPSLYEGLPVALIEAQASGIKCIISDGIPTESILVEKNMEVVSLKKSPKYWAERILANAEYERNDVSLIIKEKGYDIIENAKKLEEKYIELVEKYSQTLPLN